MTPHGGVRSVDTFDAHAWQQAQDEAAFTAYVSALKDAQRRGDLRRQAAALTHLGGLYVAHAQGDDALGAYRAAYARYLRVNDTHACARVLSYVAEMCVEMGQVIEALALHHRAFALYRKAHDRLGQADVLVTLGRLYAGMGHREKAAEVLYAATHRYDDLRATQGQARHWGAREAVLHQLLRAQALARVLNVPLETIAVVEKGIRQLLRAGA